MSESFAATNSQTVFINDPDEKISFKRGRKCRIGKLDQLIFKALEKSRKGKSIKAY